MTPDLAAAVDRIATQAGWCAVQRDHEADRDPSKPWPRYATDFHRDALVYAFAACHAADAGLCDISMALDRDSAAEMTGTRHPTAAQYAERVRAAVDQNR